MQKIGRLRKQSGRLIGCYVDLYAAFSYIERYETFADAYFNASHELAYGQRERVLFLLTHFHSLAQNMAGLDCQSDLLVGDVLNNLLLHAMQNAEQHKKRAWAKFYAEFKKVCDTGKEVREKRGLKQLCAKNPTLATRLKLYKNGMYVFCAKAAFSDYDVVDIDIERKNSELIIKRQGARI